MNLKLFVSSLFVVASMTMMKSQASEGESEEDISELKFVRENKIEKYDEFKNLKMNDHEGDILTIILGFFRLKELINLRKIDKFFYRQTVRAAQGVFKRDDPESFLTLDGQKMPKKYLKNPGYTFPFFECFSKVKLKNITPGAIQRIYNGNITHFVLLPQQSFKLDHTYNLESHMDRISINYDGIKELINCVKNDKNIEKNKLQYIDVSEYFSMPDLGLLSWWKKSTQATREEIVKSFAEHVNTMLFLGGDIAEALKKFSNVKELNFKNAPLSRRLMSCLSEMGCLESLNLSLNHIDENLFENSLPDLKKIKNTCISLDFNSFSQYSELKSTLEKLIEDKKLKINTLKVKMFEINQLAENIEKRNEILDCLLNEELPKKIQFLEIKCPVVADDSRLIKLLQSKLSFKKLTLDFPVNLPNNEESLAYGEGNSDAGPKIYELMGQLSLSKIENLCLTFNDEKIVDHLVKFSIPVSSISMDNCYNKSTIELLRQNFSSLSNLVLGNVGKEVLDSLFHDVEKVKLPLTGLGISDRSDIIIDKIVKSHFALESLKIDFPVTVDEIFSILNSKRKLTSFGLFVGKSMSEILYVDSVRLKKAFKDSLLKKMIFSGKGKLIEKGSGKLGLTCDYQFDHANDLIQDIAEMLYNRGIQIEMRLLS